MIGDGARDASKEVQTGGRGGPTPSCWQAPNGARNFHGKLCPWSPDNPRMDAHWIGGSCAVRAEKNSGQVTGKETCDSTVWHADMPKHSYGDDAVLGTIIHAHVDGAGNTGALTALSRFY